MVILLKVCLSIFFLKVVTSDYNEVTIFFKLLNLSYVEPKVVYEAG